MQLVEELRREHTELRAILDCLEQALTVIGSSEQEIDFAELAEAVYFMTEYRDIVHHSKEALLLRQLARRRRRLRALVRELGEHHASLKSEGINFLELLEDAAEDAIVSREEMLACGRRYCSAQREHLRRLEASVFPEVEREFGADDRHALGQHQEHAREALIERLTHEQFERLARQLGARGPGVSAQRSGVPGS